MKTILLLITLIFAVNLQFVMAQGAAVARSIRSIVTDESTEAIPSKYTKPMASRPGSSTDPKGQEVVLDDLVVFEAFEKHQEWHNALVVVDWTGSMYQYGAQVLRWHQLNMKKKVLKHMVLFNDGDDNLHRRSPKRIGNTGGIYHTNPNNLEAVLSTIEKSVDNGNGAECEENDLEAVLAAQQTYEDYNYLILIADSKSWIRDMVLLDQVNVPVHIILCDKGPYIEDYLKLAKKTGGSMISRFDEIDFGLKGAVTSAGEFVFGGKTYR
ncbi:hypothetical protein N9933_02165 [bacterium]|nr:hypothetical protein [bacterium]